MTTASLPHPPTRSPQAERGSLALADAGMEVEPTTQGHARDLTAALSMILIVILYHVQDEVLREGSQIGLAFRNIALRRVLTILLACAGVALAVISQREIAKSAPAWMRAVNLVASVVVAAFVISIALFVFFGTNVIASSTQGMALEIAAFVAVIILAAPWQRVALYRTTFAQIFPALLIAAGVLILWEVLIGAFDIKQFLLPRPSVIAGTFLNTFPKLISSGWFTFQNALWGYVFGCGAGIIVGLVSARFINFSRAILPFAIAANSTPIIAFAPIMNFWFGTLNPGSKIAICAVLTFFPVMINTVRGLTTADEGSLELMRSYAAREIEVFRKVRLPSALPFIFSALKVCTTLAMIGAVIGEFFGGSTSGIGFFIRNAPSNFDFAGAWSAIVVVSVLGILFYVVVSLVERVVMPWHVSFRDKSV